jgi:hypothetical protein
MIAGSWQALGGPPVNTVAGLEMPPSAQLSQARPRIEGAFAWLKTIAGMRKVKLRGREKVDAVFVFACAACNLKRIVTLRATPA